MSDYIAAKDVTPQDTLVQWQGYHVVRFEPSATHGGRIRLLDRRGRSCWFPVNPDETVEIETRGDRDV